MTQPHTLAQLKPGQHGIVDRFLKAGPGVLRLHEMGLLRGTRVDFVRCAPLGDPIQIRLRGYNLTLRKEDASAIVLRTS